MIILERLQTLSDEQLEELLTLIAEHKNKNERWKAFNQSPLKSALEIEYDIDKSSFLRPQGIEALGRKHLKDTPKGYLNVTGFRELVSQEIQNIRSQSAVSQSYAQTTQTKKAGSTGPTFFLILIVLLGSIAFFGVQFWDAKSEKKDEFFLIANSINAQSSETAIEHAIKLADDFNSRFKDSDIDDRREELLQLWRQVTNGEFQTPEESLLFKKVSAIPYENYYQNMKGYQELSRLNPENLAYGEKYAKYKSLYESERDYLESMRLIPNSYASCNRTYSETSRVVTSTTSESPYLKYNVLSGKVSIEPGKVTEQDNVVTSSMDDGVFFEFCATGARWNPRTDACPYFMECVSAVYHKKERLQGNPKVYDFEGVARILRDESIRTGDLQPSVEVSRGVSAYGKPDLLLSEVRNFKNACDVVSSTYSSNVVAAEIYKHVPEVPSFAVAKTLGEKAVQGYGECHCALQNYTGINQVLSIGYCRGDRYFDY